MKLFLFPSSGETIAQKLLPFLPQNEILPIQAMFQFCNQASNYSNAYDGDLLSVVSFHWGGRPLVIETDGEFYNAELVLATLHHGMIDSTVDVGGGGGGGDDHGHEIGNGGGGSARGGGASCEY